MASEEKFDPMKSHVASLIIPRLSNVADRARKTLLNKTSDEVRIAQETIAGWIEAYFETMFEEEVADLRSRAKSGNERAIGYFHTDRIYYDDHWDAYDLEILGFNDRYSDDLDIPTEGNTTEIEALNACIDWFDLSETVFGDGSEPLFFAALALKFVEKAMWHLEKWTNPDAISVDMNELLAEIHTITKKIISKKVDVRSKNYPPVNFEFKLACEAAMDALEAVVTADTFQSLNWQIKRFAEKSEKAVSAAEEDLIARQAIEDALAKKEKTKKLNEKREAKRKEALSCVLEDWELDTSRFPSAEEAGKHYAAWLMAVPGKNFKFAATTCRDWIRDRAREIGLRWR